MVIPWIGIPLASVVKAVEPTSKAKYVAFQTLHDPRQMPGQQRSVLQWPYVEGLRLDEAMHPLTLLAVGLYGETLPNQNGAPPPARGAVEVRIQEHQVNREDSIRENHSRPTSWNLSAPQEYGFYSNVNPGCRPSPLEPGQGTPDRRVL